MLVIEHYKLKRRLEIALEYQEECIKNYMAEIPSIESRSSREYGFEKKMITWHKGKRAGIREAIELIKRKGL